ncbi:dipeptide epimerase [Paraflavisolibacter sp. H34]|uniref:mandelate racemase/muconate lactonizing enzyme family protein n=1 Tax=Huijunlia imazamoxiresistens TaxID=3127457 RepID=UPI0030174BFE
MKKSTAISSVELYRINIPLTEPFVISLGPIEQAANVVVVIRTADGCTGFGECSPYMTINGESADTCFIVGQYLARVLKGQDALEVAYCSQAMDKVIYGNSSIKSAFDMALHDIAAQQAGLPLYRFLGGARNKALETDMTVSIGAPDKMKSDAVKFRQQGFPAIKVKLGGSLQEDVARIHAIREGIGRDVPLRIDANQGWPTADAAIAVLTALAPYAIEHCEEPIPRWRFMELARVSAASPIPVMADESCGDDHDAERLIALKACPMINIKLGKSSGFVKAQKIVALAAQAGMKLQIGGFMESRLGMTASAHLALTHECIVHCDFDTPLMFTADPVVGGITYGPAGRVTVPETPGLGAVVDEAFLKQGEQVVI